MTVLKIILVVCCVVIAVLVLGRLNPERTDPDFIVFEFDIVVRGIEVGLLSFLALIKIFADD